MDDKDLDDDAMSLADDLPEPETYIGSVYPHNAHAQGQAAGAANGAHEHMGLQVDNEDAELLGNHEGQSPILGQVMRSQSVATLPEEFYPGNAEGGEEQEGENAEQDVDGSEKIIDQQLDIDEEATKEIEKSDQPLTITKIEMTKEQHVAFFLKLREEIEANYNDEMGLEEAKFYAKGQMNDQELIPNIANLKPETLEKEMKFTEDDRTVFEETAVDGSKVRNLDNFSVYDKFGNMISLLDVLEKPYYDYKNEVVIYGTLVPVLPKALRGNQLPSGAPRPSRREMVRECLEKPIPRGFRQSDFCTATLIDTKDTLTIAKFAPKSPGAGGGNELVLTPAKGLFENKNRGGSMNQTAFFQCDISREEANAQAKVLLKNAKLPIKIGTVRIMNLGQLVTDGINAAAYHNQKHLYPVGFLSIRQYASVVDPDAKVDYTSEILEGPEGPIFRVTHEGGQPIFEGATSSAVWLQILKSLNEKKAGMGLPPKGTAVSGPEMMGFAHKKIASLLEGLPGALSCREYIFRAQRPETIGSGKLPTPIVVGEKRKFPETGMASPATPMSVTSDISHNDTYKPTPAKPSTTSSVVPLSEDIFSNTETFEKAVSRPKAQAASATLSEDELNNIKRLSKQLSLLQTNEDKQLEQALEQLRGIRIDVDTLMETGLGKLVNRLRKHQSSEVAHEAKSLKKKWVKHSSDENSIQMTQEDKLVARKICSKIASFVGFGDERAPKSIKGYDAKGSPRSKLLECLKEIDDKYASKIPVEVLHDSQLGKRVNKLRKHLDEEVQTVALKLKVGWKKIMAEDEERKEQEVVVANTIRVGSSNGPQNISPTKVPTALVNVSANSSSEPSEPNAKKARTESFVAHAAEPGDTFAVARQKVVPLPPDLEAVAAETLHVIFSSRKRIKLGPIIGLQITHRDGDATLWVATEDARYRIAGEIGSLVPSHRYFAHFREAFFAFQAAYLTIRKLREEQQTLSLANLPPSLSAVAFKRAKVRMMLMLAGKVITSSSPCPCPASSEAGKLGRLGKDKRSQRLGFDDIVDNFEIIIDEITRMSQDKARVQKWIDHWFVDIMILRGNCIHAKKKRDNLRREKEYFRQLENPNSILVSRPQTGVVAKPSQTTGTKMVTEGIGLPDDLDIIADDLLPADLQRLNYLPKDVFSPRPAIIYFEDLNFDLVMQNMKTFVSTQSLPSVAKGQGPHSLEYFEDLMSIWFSLRKVNHVLDVVPQKLVENFTLFRSSYCNGDALDQMFVKLLDAIVKDDATAQKNLTEKETSPYVVDENDFKIATRSNADQYGSGFVKPLVESSDKTDSYAYDTDQLYPFPDLVVSKSSWPEVLRRFIQYELLRESGRLEDIDNVTGDGYIAPLDAQYRSRRAELVVKPDLILTCEELVNELLDNPMSAAFSVPVNIKDYPNYMALIHRPMDLGTIKERIKNGHYDLRNRPKGADYEAELEMPVVKVEELQGKDEDELSEDDENETAGDNHSEQADDEPEESITELENGGRIMEYVIPRKIKKYGKWKMKSEYMLNQDVKSKVQEVEELTVDQKFYVHDCKGAVHKGILADVRQIWRNCRRYNKNFTKIVNDSWKLEEHFSKQYNKRVLARDPEINGQLKLAMKQDAQIDKEFGQIDEQGDGFFALHNKYATIGEIFRALGQCEDYSLLPFNFKLAITAWLLDKFSDTAVYRQYLSENVEKLQNLEKDERQKEEAAKTSLASPTVQNGNKLLPDQIKFDLQDMFHSESFDYMNTFEPIGTDRYHNRYYCIYPFVQDFGWLLVEEPATGKWGVFQGDKIDQLMKSFDRRGLRENALHKALSKFWASKLALCSKMNAERTMDLVTKHGGLTGAAKQTLESEKTRLHDQLVGLQLQYQRVSNEAQHWSSAPDPSSGKTYFYHKETRQSTWDEPTSFKQQTELQQRIQQLQDSIADVQAREDLKPEDLEKQLMNDGSLLHLYNLALAKADQPIPTTGQKSHRTMILSKTENFFKERVLNFVADLQALEIVTIAPDGRGVNFSPTEYHWSSKLRKQWLAQINEIVNICQSNLSIVERPRSKAFMLLKRTNERKDTDAVSEVINDMVEMVETIPSHVLALPKLVAERKLDSLIDDWRKDEVGEVAVEYSFRIQGPAHLIDVCRSVLKTLYSQYVGNPYQVNELKAQEAIIKAVRHETRWMRRVEDSKTLPQLSLMFAQLMHILGLSREDHRFEKARKNILVRLHE